MKESTYDPDDIRKSGTNLCFFMRVTLVYAPLTVAFHLAMYILIIATMTAIPIYLFGFAWYARIGEIIMMLVGVYLLMRGKKRIAPTGVAVLTRMEPGEDSDTRMVRPPTFRKVIWEYIQALEKKVCPRITFAQEQESES